MKCVKRQREPGFYAFSKAEHITLLHDLHTNEWMNNLIVFLGN